MLGKNKQVDILTIGAHNDDYIVGAGGTLAAYRKEGKSFYSLVFSYGENSHPHFKKKISIRMRVKESRHADKLLGGAGIAYIGVPEGKILEDAWREKEKNVLKRLIRKKQPEKIFTHSDDDPHPDHVAVNTLVKEVLREIHYEGAVYSFGVWNLFTLKKTDNPQLVVDIKDTFHKKIEAFRAHRSQRMTYLVLTWHLYLKAIIHGLRFGYRYCEVFDRVHVHED